jgi:hypothetical protein
MMSSGGAACTHILQLCTWCRQQSCFTLLPHLRMQHHAMPAHLARFAAAGSHPGLQHVNDCGKRISFLNQQVWPTSQRLRCHTLVMTAVFDASTTWRLQSTGSAIGNELPSVLHVYPPGLTGS